jgi:hypothetical protein
VLPRGNEARIPTRSRFKPSAESATLALVFRVGGLTTAVAVACAPAPLPSQAPPSEASPEPAPLIVPQAPDPNPPVPPAYSLPATAPSTQPNEPKFPSGVAGFEYGITGAQAQALCPDWEGKLPDHLICRAPPEPLPFGNGAVSLSFSLDRLTKVSAVVILHDALIMLQSKYGPAGGATERAIGWALPGGTISVIRVPPPEKGTLGAFLNATRRVDTGPELIMVTYESKPARGENW